MGEGDTHFVENATEAERAKASRPYDGIAQFSERHQKMGKSLMSAAASLERGYQSYLGSGKLEVFRQQVQATEKAHKKWLADVDGFKELLLAEGTDSKAMHYIGEAFDLLAKPLMELARLVAE